MTSGIKQPQIKFFQEDVVGSSDNARGVVLRCWHDSDQVAIPDLSIDPLLRPLERGEVGVSFYPGHKRAILPDSSLELLDRTLQAGDICKRRHDDVQSAVVTKTEVAFKVSHAISQRLLDERFTLSDIKEDEDVAIGDFVVYDDWIGQVQNFFDDAVIQTANGKLMRVPEVSAHLTVGERGGDILPSTSGENGQSFLSYLLGGTRASVFDTVVDVKHTVYAIAWMAINQMLSPEEIARRQRPQKFWYGPDISKLTLVRGVSDQQPHVGHHVTLKNPPEDFVTLHGTGGEQFKVETGVVWETETTVDLLWQDGTRERCRTTDLIPYLNPDEHDCWPGDHVVWKEDEEEHPAVVQSVNAMERTAVILLEDGRRERVSVLEIDSRGNQADSNMQDTFGVRRGDSVFIHSEGNNNSCRKPMVPSIGELEPWVREMPLPGPEHGKAEGWIGELDAIGQNIALKGEPEKYSVGRIFPGQGGIRWYGEVTDLRLDGLIEVTFPDMTTTIVPLERLTRLHDGLDQLWGDEISDDHSDSESTDGGRRMYEVQTEDGRWVTVEAGNDDEWVEDEDIEMDYESEDDEPPVLQPVVDPLNPSVMPLSKTVLQSLDDVPGSWPHETVEGFLASRTPDVSTPRQSDVPMDATEQTPEANSSLSNVASTSSSCKRFEILPSAPSDHAFISKSIGQPSRQFLGRLTREYRGLETGLPDSIIVQTYEDRTDLLRSLIIGSENTPYEDAPFVIDWMLNGDFPHSPPTAHFWSWTNGNGRVNPNLYEEGKVCLSILGTWEGDRSESWSPSRSSLLQALVSIQGLVLVKEPWYCEPAYEKWRGTDEGRVNSRLYNERAYVLSRGFVRRALETPLGGLHSVIHDIYITKGRLDKVITHSKALIAKSKETKDANEGTSDLAVPRLTDGGIIPLTRTLGKLEAMLASHS